MNDPALLEPITPVVRIGMRGLANLTNNMIGGGLYVLIAETPSARFPMLAESLGNVLKDGMPCTVIVSANHPDLFLQRVQSFDSSITPELVVANRLQVFEMQEEFQKTMFRFGAEGFVKELEYFGIPESSYLVFDQADELLSLHDMSMALDQVEILSKWLAQRQVTALLVFTRVTEVYSENINALMDSLTGIARLGGNRDGLELTFDYWQSPEGTIAARSYRLVTLDSGLYEATTKTMLSEQAPNGSYEAEAEEEDAEPQFFYMDPDLGSLAKQMPGTWQRVDTLVGMMHATRVSRSATAILTFQADTNLRQLAETVHTLRLSLGHRAHIVIQEKGASLRYQNEALLLRLGVNLVIHKDVLTSRLPLLLESLRGQVFNRDVNINFEAALASVMPTRLRGYILPLRFVREVDVILDRAETLNVPCAMIIGRPNEDMTMADILMQINLSRSGDLITADNEFCYLFLNACPQAVLLATLERLLGRSVDTALNDLRFLVQRPEIDSELARLSRAADRGSLPDYSSMSEAVQPSESPVAETMDSKPAFTNRSTSSPIAPGEPIAQLLSAWAPNEPKVRVLQEQPVFAAPEKPSMSQSTKPGSTPPPPVFGKKEAPRATRSAPLANSGTAP